MTTAAEGSDNPPAGSGEALAPELAKTVAETGPETLGMRPSFAHSNRPLGADLETEPSVPHTHFGNTPLAPTLSPDSARKSRGSKAAALPVLDNSNNAVVAGLDETVPTTAAAASLPPSEEAGPMAQNCAPTQVQFLEPTQIIDIMGNDEPGSLPAMPATLLQTQVLLGTTQVHAATQQEEQRVEPTQNGLVAGVIIIPDTEDAMYAAAVGGAPTAIEDPSEDEDYEQQIAELESELREKWLGSYSSEAPLTGVTMPNTAATAEMQISSLHGDFAEAVVLLEEWQARANHGDELCQLRLHLLATVQRQIPEVLFGPGNAQKLPEVTLNYWTWFLATVFQRAETIDSPFQLLGNISFSLVDGNSGDGGENASFGDLSEEDADNVAQYLCTKEEFAKRKERVAAVEGGEYALTFESGERRGVSFTIEELLDTFKALSQPPAPPSTRAAPAAAPENPSQQQQQQQRPPETETEAGLVPTVAIVLENDGPDALDINASYPVQQPPAVDASQQKEQQEEQPPAQPAAAADGPDELQVDLTVPQPSSHNTENKRAASVPSSENRRLEDTHGSENPLLTGSAGASALPPPQQPRGVGWMAGGWAPQEPSGSLPESETGPAPGIDMGTLPASDQNTPSGMFKNRNATAGDNGGGGGGGVLPSAVVPETQPEQLQQRLQSDGMDMDMDMDSAVRPAAPGAQLNMHLAGATETDGGDGGDDVDGSQPVGSQQVKDALRIAGMLGDEIEAESQQEVPLGSGLHLFGKVAGGGAAAAAAEGAGAAGGASGGFAVPAPRQSSRLGPKAVAKAPAAKELPQKLQQPAPQQQQRRQKSVPKLNAKKVELLKAHRGKVMTKNRPDLGHVDKLRVVKAPAPVAPTRRLSHRQHKAQQQQQQQQQQQLPLVDDEGAPIPPTTRTTNKIFLSGLHDTEDCFEMAGTDSTAQEPSTTPAPAAKTVTKAQAPAGSHRHSPRRSTGVLLAAIADHEGKRSGLASPKKSPKKADQPPLPLGNGHESDPFRFPSDTVLRDDTSPKPLLTSPARKSPCRPVPDKAAVDKTTAEKTTTAAAPMVAEQPLAPRQPYQPGPIRENIDGLLITRLPHPIIQTADDYDYSSLEISITAGVADVQTTTQVVAVARRAKSPRKRKQEEAVAVAGGAGPSSKRQKNDDIADKNAVCNDDQGGRRAGRRQAAAAKTPADSDQTIKERWLSTGTKRKQIVEIVSYPVSSPCPQRAAKEAAEKKLQTRRSSGGGGGGGGGSRSRLSPPPPGVTYGCGKCRHSINGCTACRTRYKRDLAKAEAEANAGAAPPRSAEKKKTLLAALAATAHRPNRRDTVPILPQKTRTNLYTLPTPAIKPATVAATTTAPLQGMCFLVSGGSGDSSEPKGAIEELITSLGGRVLSEIPPPPPAGTTSLGIATTNRRLSVDLRSPAAHPQVDAVITDRHARKAKCIYAAIKGLPVVSPDWLKVCKRTKKRVALTAKYQLLAEANPPPAPVFAGLRVFYKVVGNKNLAQSIAQLMQHAGAQTTSAPKESTKDEPTCDLVIIDDDVSDKDRVALQRLARRLHVPCHNRDWAIRAMLQGALPSDYAPRHPVSAAAAPCSPDEPPQNEDVEMEEERDDVPEPSPSVEFVQGQGGGEEAAAEPAGGAGASGAGGASTAAVRRSRRKHPHEEIPVVEDMPLPARKRGKPSPKVALPTATATAATASPEPSSFTWMGKPVSPPEGCTPAGRRYYSAVMYNNQRIQVGSHVELSAMPGESAPRVAQVAALWAERDVNGQDKPFGRFIRLLRPDDTSLALVFLQSHKKQVFMSSVEEPRLSLKGIERRCVVAFPSCADELTNATQQQVNGQEAADYVCMAQYDLQDGVLKPLPQQ